MFANNYFKTLGAKRIETLIGSAVAYSDSTTLEAFVADAVEGEIGVFNADTGALITGAVSGTTRFVVALKRGGLVHKNTPMTANKIEKAKIAYTAPVKQVTDIAIGTRASLTVQNIVFKARQGGTGGNSITVTYVDPAGNNAALSVGVVGTDITVNLATDGASAPTSTGAQVLAALLASAAVQALVETTGTGTMTTVQAAAAQAPLANGAAAAAIAAGDEIGFIITDRTVQTQPFPTYVFNEVVKTGDTLNTVFARLLARVNSTSSFENRDRDVPVIASGDGSLFTFTAKLYGSWFGVTLTGKLNSIGTVNYFTKYKLGSGFYEHVRYMEETGDIFRGVTTNYPDQNATPAEFGAPPSLVSSSNTYNMYQLVELRQEASRTPHNVWHNMATQALAVPSNGTNPTASLDTIFGF